MCDWNFVEGLGQASVVSGNGANTARARQCWRISFRGFAEGPAAEETCVLLPRVGTRKHSSPWSRSNSGV